MRIDKTLEEYYADKRREDEAAKAAAAAQQQAGLAVRTQAKLAEIAWSDASAAERSVITRQLQATQPDKVNDPDVIWFALMRLRASVGII